VPIAESGAAPDPARLLAFRDMQPPQRTACFRLEPRSVTRKAPAVVLRSQEYLTILGSNIDLKVRPRYLDLDGGSIGCAKITGAHASLDERLRRARSRMMGPGLRGHSCRSHRAGELSRLRPAGARRSCRDRAPRGPALLVLSSSTNRSSRAKMAAIGRLSGRVGCALSGPPV
jgi:hypothetical protein